MTIEIDPVLEAQRKRLNSLIDRAGWIAATNQDADLDPEEAYFVVYLAAEIVRGALVRAAKREVPDQVEAVICCLNNAVGKVRVLMRAFEEHAARKEKDLEK